jgi:hypothetical protein
MQHKNTYPKAYKVHESVKLAFLGKEEIHHISETSLPTKNTTK